MKGQLLKNAKHHFPIGFDVLEHMKRDTGDPERKELQHQNLDGEIRTTYFSI